MFGADVIRRARELLRSTPTSVHVGHRYVDVVTGERFDIVSVGRKTEVERLDADRRPGNSVKTSTLRAAIDSGAVEHDPDKCPECN